MVGPVESIGAFIDGPGQEGRGLPKRGIVKEFQTIKFEGDVWRGARGYKAAGSQAHPKASKTHCEACVIRQVRHQVDKGELKIQWILLRRRRMHRLSRHQPGYPFNVEPQSVAQMEIRKQGNALKQIGVAFTPDAEVRILVALESFPPLPA